MGKIAVKYLGVSAVVAAIGDGVLVDRCCHSANLDVHLMVALVI